MDLVQKTHKKTFLKMKILQENKIVCKNLKSIIKIA